jgi:diguanylate cyclase
MLPIKLRPMAGITIAYAICGLLALRMAIPPGYVAPLFPSAGIALAGVLIYGERIWPAIFLGAFVTNIEAVILSGLGGEGWIMPLCVSTGAVMQALAGAALARRWIGFPNALDTAGAILRFLFAAAPVSCVISASIGVGTLVLLGAIPLNEAPFSWWNWWAGDAIGILVAAPLTFVFFGRPRKDWASRRLALALPLSVALILLIGLEIQVGKWEQERLQSRFERDARYLSSLLFTRFSDYLDVLQSAERVMVAAPELDHDGFQRFGASWLSRFGGLQAIGWIPRVTDKQRAAMESAARADDTTRSFRIIEHASGGQLITAGLRAEYYPIRYITPLEANRKALGIDVLTVSAPAEAIPGTLKDGKAAATRAFTLTQETEGKLGVVIYQRTSPAATREAGKPDGLVFVALRIEDAIKGALQGHPISGIDYCLSDVTTAPGQGERLAGLAECPDQDTQGTGGLTPWVETFDFGGRTWALHLVAAPNYAVLYRGWEAWTLLAIGLLSVGTLGAFLLTTTGHARRVEDLVHLRTNELADAGRRLSAQQAILTHAERIAHLGSWEADPLTGQGRWSKELYRILGIPTIDDSNLSRLISAIHPDDQSRLRDALQEAERGIASASLDIRLPDHADGSEPRIVHFTIEASAGRDGTQTLRGTVQDVTDSRAAEAHIHYLAHYDPLTGLPNRRLWVSQAEQALAFARRNQLRLGVLFLDLDNFKKINDTLGHPVGDRLLSAVAHRLSRCLRDEDVLARLGGDEFVVLLPQLTRADDAATVARKLLASLSRPCDIDGQELTVSTSIGIALFPGNGADVDVLLKHADTAMYDAKNEGRNDFRFFTPEMNSRAYARLMIENALRRAIERNELVLEYQPQWEMPAQRLIGVEALVRWDNPEQGRIPPNDFIPIAEETGLIQAIGDWVLNEACRQQAEWQANGLPPLVVAVNISALQFRKSGFVDRIRHIFAKNGVSPRTFELEITESALMQPSPDTEHQFATLRAMGLGLALDDFGTGYSSLSYLKRLPLTRLKIDRSFVQDLPGDPEDAAIASATLSIARDLGLEVVAEGVETEAQRDFLLTRQCHIMQGFLLGRPMPAAGITGLLQEAAGHGVVTRV